MATQDYPYFAFNRGLVDRLGLARVDVKRLALAADVYVNYMPRVLGSMMLRAGTMYIGRVYNDQIPHYLPFVFSTSDKALIELTPAVMRIWVNDALVTRPAVTAAVQNGDFATTLANWTDNDEAGATSAWAAPNYMGLTGTGTNAAIRDQQVVVNEPGTEHALNIVIARGPVMLRVGSTLGNDDYISETELGTGNHSLAFTPGATFFIRFFSRLERVTYVDSCNLAAAGVMTITTPWGAGDLASIRTDQSADVVYVACSGIQQRKIERRATRSWSCVVYQPNDGPFRTQNTSTMTLTPSVLSGNGTLSSSAPFFKATHVGALFAVTSTGQSTTKVISAQNVFADPIRVTGVGADRAFTLDIAGLSGTGSTVTLQRSFTTPTTWADVANYVADTTANFQDTFDNQVVYYRLGVKVGNYVAGNIACTLVITTGSIRGICRVVQFSTSTAVNMEVLVAFGGVAASLEWEEGKWSDYRGWPTAVGFYEGRLGWSGKDGVALSESDGYESFDPTVVADNGPIVRTIGQGQVDTINWMLPLQRLVLGGQGAEFSCRSTAFDEPLTPTNFNIKRPSTQGSAPVAAAAVDDVGVFVQRGGFRVFQLEFNSDRFDYKSAHLSALVPTIGKPGITRIAVQRRPDTRLHFVRSDGTVAVLVFDVNENVTCWLEVETGNSGTIVDAVVLPGGEGEQEDHVYYAVARTVNGGTRYYLERWSTEAQCRGVDDAGVVTPLCYLGDCNIAKTGIGSNQISGLDHLEGNQVTVWADGKDMGTDENDNLTYTVTGGKVVLPVTVQQAVVGIRYTAQWRSGKLVELQDQLGTAMKNQKNIKGLGLVLADVHAKGVKFGQDFNNLDDLASVEDGAPVDPDAMREDLDDNTYVFPGTWDVDSRVCLQSMAPRPATILALVATTDF